MVNLISLYSIKGNLLYNNINVLILVLLERSCTCYQFWFTIRQMKQFLNYLVHNTVLLKIRISTKIYMILLINITKKNHQNQECLLLINYYNTNTSQRKFELGRLERENDDFKFTVIDEVLKNKILKELNVTSFNTYEKDQYFKILTIEAEEDYYLKEIDTKSKKIRLKYYTWDDLNANNKPLHENLIDIIFDRENVFNLATSKSSNAYKLLDKDILTVLYRSALNTIGFISEDLDMERTVLHGDIGEFLMNYMVRKYIMQDNPDLYLLPKLVFKTDPNMAVHGNDGTFYNKKTKKI